MSKDIGESAGLVWRILNVKGSASVKQIMRETGLKPKEVERAIGWLAREDKVQIVFKGRTEQVFLNEG